ncbi:hypothetical protein UlMin_026424 [Ulmus minor]
MSPTKQAFTAASSNTVTSAETIANNGDLLTLILIQLPIRSLLKFKAVSKHWLSLISDPDFRRRASSKTKPISGLFLFRTLTPFYDFLSLGDDNPALAPSRPLTFVQHPSEIKILQSCNGLLLCCSYETDQPFSGSYETHEPCTRFYIYNPTTNRFNKLPRLRGDEKRFVLSMNIAFDPSISPHYKVVCFQCHTSLWQCQIKIYSSETDGPWKISGNPFSIQEIDRLVFDTGVFCNGTIHWISRSERSLCFDFNKEERRELPMPVIPGGWDDSTVRYFGESHGHLHISNLYEAAKTQIDLYEIEKDYSGWFLKYRVDIGGVVAAFPEMIRRNLDPSDMDYYGFSILCLVREEVDDESFLVLHVPGKAIRFRIKDGIFSKLCEFGADRIGMEVESAMDFGWFDAFQYIETLASV